LRVKFIFRLDFVRESNRHRPYCQNGGGRVKSIVKSGLGDPTARRTSLLAVLDCAWASGEFTANDIMRRVPLTRSTTIEAIESLIRLGLLIELENARSTDHYRKGRPARRFVLRADAGAVIGIDLGHTHLLVDVADLHGTVLARIRRDLERGHDSVEERRDAVDTAIADVIAAATLDPASVLAICVGVAAPVSRGGDSPVHPRGFWARMNPGLNELLERWAPAVRIVNDASLAAVAEGSKGAAQGCRDYVALLGGARLGAGVVIDGHLLHGAHGGVGEMVAFDHVDGVHGAIGLGHRAADWAKEDIDSGLIAPTAPLALLPRAELDGRAVLALADEGDPDAVRIAERVGALLARVVSVFGSMFDPQRVVVCGSLTARLGLIVDAARRALPSDLDLPAPEIVVSTLGADVVVVGAVSAALDLARTHALDARRRAPAAGHIDPIVG
jgi:predicted NBD/HSP70 family sugar kinase